MKTIICSHGFGVRADSRGMFPEIAAAFPDYYFRMFDYCEVKPNGDTVLRPIEEQAKILQKEIDTVEGDEITLLCHSMGSVIAGMVDLTKVNKIILLAPPEKMYNRLKQWLKIRPGSHFQDDGTFVLPRSDGSTSYLPPEYIKSLEDKDPMELYQKIANTKPTVIVRATNDEVIGLTNMAQIKNAQHVDIEADHNFAGAARQRLLTTLDPIL